MHQNTCGLSARPVSIANLLWISCSTLCDGATDHNLSETCYQWLLDTGSLTAKLKAQCPDAFRVDVLFQEWQQPRTEESDFLGQPRHIEANVREVLLLCHDTPVVFARTIIPASSLEGENSQLLHLNNKPLGELLFSQPTLKRGPIDVTKTVDTNNHTVWGRRSVFTLNNKPLVVSEFFLPALFDRQSPIRPAGAISE